MRRILLTALAFLVSTSAQAAGFRALQIPASADGPALRALVWTPCAAPAEELKLGPYVLAGTRNCPAVGEKLPLVVLSHGHGGSALGHHDLAERLADAGFVVAAVNHPGDTFSDMSRQYEMSEFVERPVDIKRLIDAMLTTDLDAAKIDRNSIGFFGFSRGGYTGLVLAGGNPDFVHANVPCPDPKLAICGQVARHEVPTSGWTHDDRIKAFVLADPFDEFPTRESVKDIRTPIQLWASELGGEGVLPEMSHDLAGILPTKPEFHIVPGAAHFAFLAPCSPELSKAAAAICVDGNGFDRVAFHRAMNDAVLTFFERHLNAGH